jgi:uncharacterized glyoxalase superfamily protein PhnB
VHSSWQREERVARLAQPGDAQLDVPTAKVKTPRLRHLELVTLDLGVRVLAREWQTAGLDVNMPEATEWGQHEGAVVDPDGNVLRFGSPLSRSTTD